jgi:hypothetical protein
MLPNVPDSSTAAFYPLKRLYEAELRLLMLFEAFWARHQRLIKAFLVFSKQFETSKLGGKWKNNTGSQTNERHELKCTYCIPIEQQL